MSEERRHDSDPFEGDELIGEDGLEADEPEGLGLTDEFARIEAEIQGEAEPGEATPERPGEPGEPLAPGSEEGAAEPTPAEGAAEPAPEEVAAAPEVEASEAPAPDPDAAAADAADGSGEDADDAGAPAADEQPPTVADGPAPTEVHRPGSVGRRPAAKPLTRPTLPAAAAEEEPVVRIPSLWLRFMAGSVLIVASMAASVAVAGLLLLDDLVEDLRPIPGVQKQLAQVESDAPQTILIIGSDKRASDPKDLGARSDTTMLLRVDPDREVLSLFSLPRDLKVDIPGVGPRKLNEAYTIGGPKKTLQTVSRFTGLDINHVVEINFSGFADAVNAIDCVYVDVDREYFNDNSGVSVEEQYAEIDINAGYQRLCGLKALQYVRYRHTDTDLVRSARQQDFLREARQKVEPRELIPLIGGTGNELIDIFTSYVDSDIDDKADVIGILKSFIAVRSVPVNEVHFEGDIGGPDNPFVTSTDNQVQKAIDEFLNGVGSPGQRGGSESNKKKDGEKQKRKKKEKKDPTDGADVVATDTQPDSKLPTLADRFKKDADKNARRLGIPVFYPTEVVPGSSFSPDSRTYEYRNEEDKREDAYKTVIAYQTPSTLTEYYGVMGTTWSDPPILRNPSEERKIGGREYLLFYDGDRLRLVGWEQKGNSYWLNNTLSQSLGEAEMLAIASSMREA